MCTYIYIYINDNNNANYNDSTNHTHNTNIHKLFTLLDVCVSSVRRGHAIFSVSFRFERMIPKGNPIEQASPTKYYQTYNGCF